MTTKRQEELEQAARQALGELGPNTSTEFLIAVTSERTKVEPNEIIAAISAVNGRGNRHSLQSTAGLRHPQTPRPAATKESPLGSAKRVVAGLACVKSRPVRRCGGAGLETGVGGRRWRDALPGANAVAAWKILLRTLCLSAIALAPRPTEGDAVRDPRLQVCSRRPEFPPARDRGSDCLWRHLLLHTATQHRAQRWELGP
jgi:hypothetical protein